MLKGHEGMEEEDLVNYSKKGEEELMKSIFKSREELLVQWKDSKGYNIGSIMEASLVLKSPQPKKPIPQNPNVTKGQNFEVLVLSHT
jgi:hypothetical protein